MRSLSFGILLALSFPVQVGAQERGDPQQAFRDFEAGRFLAAEQGAETALTQDPDNPVWWALLAEARSENGKFQPAAEAFARAAEEDPDAQRRSYFRRAQTLNLVYAEMHAEARAVLRQAMADPSLATRDSLDWAMVAIAARDDEAAQEILANEALHADLTRQSALDAGYSAKRRGLDSRAVRFFERGLALDEIEESRLSAVERENIRREIRELERDWSFIAQGSYSTAGRPSGLSAAPLDDEQALQFGAEISRRIGGWRNGRPFSVFARVYHSEFLGDDALTGDATQGWVGVRYKPFSSLNFNVEASKLIGLDNDAIDDWSLRGAISGGEGLEPEIGRSQWTYAHYYGDLSYLFENDVAFGIAEGRFGRAFALGDRSNVITPYLVVRADLDTGREDEGALGGGAGVSLRHWFDESETAAWRGFIEFDVQARQRIAGDRRATGVLATVTIGR